MTSPRCRGCHALIRWAKSETTGKPIPIDPEPVPAGNIVVTARGIAHFLKKGEEPTVPTYVSHFSTCPARDRFKKRPPQPAA